jgi:cytochrome c oxidase subunit 2
VQSDKCKVKCSRLPTVLPFFILPFALCIGPGCHADHNQSMVHPAGEAAGRIAWLTWVLVGICTAVFLVTMGLTAVAITRKESRPLGNRFIAATGIVIPAVILTAILIASVAAQVALQTPKSANHTARVVGHMFWWEVHYPQHGIADANELHIPVGEPVLLELTSADVIHSFWVPNLHGKMDMLPEKVTRFWVQADRPGVYRGQCAEYCGTQHAKMAFEVVAHPPGEFAAWVAERQRPHPEPTGDLLRGRDLFFAAACHNCHAVRGTRAQGLVGPDLTHMGSRRTIGAATVPNTHENLARWVRNPHLDKPGNRMPHSTLPDADVEAVTRYLESLK